MAGKARGFTLVLGSVLGIMSIVILAPALPVLMDRFREVPDAPFWVASIIGLPGLGAALFSPFAGQVGDRFGRRSPLVIFCLIFAAAGAIPLFIDDFWVIYASRMIMGTAGAGVLVLSTTLIGDYFTNPARERWLAGQAMLATSSALVLMPLGGWLTATYGWRGPFIAFAIAAPLALAYWLFCPEPATSSASGQVGRSWRELPWRWLLGNCAVTLCGAVLMSIVQLQLGLSLQAVGIDDSAQIGSLSTIAVAGIPVGAMLFMVLARVPFGKLICLEFLASGGTLVLLGYASDYRIFLGIAFLNMVVGGTILPTLANHITRQLEPSVRARGIGVWQASASVGQFLSVGLTAQVMHYRGNSVLDAFWVVGLAAVAISVIALFGTVKEMAEPRPSR